MIVLALGLGCTSPAPVRPAIPVRTGWVSDTPTDRALADGRFFGQQAGERPRIADCVTLATVPLGDVRQLVAAGIPSPDTALAFSPDGAWLAVGSYLGEVVLIDAWTGQVRARRTLAESAVKRVAWSPDGATLYAAEQSVDGLLRALDPGTLADRATFRLADALSSSAPPGPDDLYGLYTLPGAYALEVLPDGDLILVGAHGWNAADGRRNQSQVWRLRPGAAGFTVVARWPEQPADATFLGATVGEQAIAVAVSRSSPGEPPAGLGVGGVALLGLADLQLQQTFVPPPLAPWFDRAFVWEGLGLHGDRLTLGLGDGRVWRPDLHRDLGTPLLAGDVPIAATIGSLVDNGTELHTLTSGTSIPYGSGRPEAQPPEPHPAENTVFALDPADLSTRWSWRGEERLHGLTERGRWLVVGVGPQDDDSARHGVLIFDLERTGSGKDRIAARCPTQQPVFFRTAIAPDGRVAVASFPAKAGDEVRGDYRVQIFL